MLFINVKFTIFHIEFLVLDNTFIDMDASNPGKDNSKQGKADSTEQLPTDELKNSHGLQSKQKKSKKRTFHNQRKQFLTCFIYFNKNF